MKLQSLSMRLLALAMIAGTPAVAQPNGAAPVAEAEVVVPLEQMTPLNRIENIPEQVATARVTDAQGKVIGAVQRVEIQNGRPTSVEIALLGADSTIALDAANLRYDAGRNVVATGQSVAQLMAQPTR